MRSKKIWEMDLPRRSQAGFLFLLLAWRGCLGVSCLGRIALALREGPVAVGLLAIKCVITC